MRCAHHLSPDRSKSSSFLNLQVLDAALDAKTLISWITNWSKTPISSCFDQADRREPESMAPMLDPLVSSADVLYSGTAKTGSGKIFGFAVTPLIASVRKSLSTCF
jgi:hypothetical protein